MNASEMNLIVSISILIFGPIFAYGMTKVYDHVNGSPRQKKC